MLWPRSCHGCKSTSLRYIGTRVHHHIIPTTCIFLQHKNALTVKFFFSSKFCDEVLINHYIIWKVVQPLLHSHYITTHICCNWNLPTFKLQTTNLQCECWLQLHHGVGNKGNQDPNKNKQREHFPNTSGVFEKNKSGIISWLRVNCSSYRTIFLIVLNEICKFIVQKNVFLNLKSTWNLQTFKVDKIP